jgi:hypothetical protein
VRSFGLCAIAAAAALGGCQPPSRPPATGEALVQGWTRPPEILSVARTAAGVLVRGQAGPNSRVVLGRGSDDRGFAANADAAGRFEVAVSGLTGSVLLQAEVRVEGEAVAAPERLLILEGGRGPVALLSPGRPSWRLDPATGLGAVDWDGRTLLLSGRTTPGQPVQVSVAGREPLTATADAAGRWSVLAERAGAGAFTVDVNGRGSRVDAAGASAAPVRGEDGWIFRWSTPAGGEQFTWLAAPR